MKVEFVKNILETETDGLRGTTLFQIFAMNERIYPEGYAKTELELLEEFEMTWKEISNVGGSNVILKEIKEVYNVDIEA